MGINKTLKGSVIAALLFVSAPVLAQPGPTCIKTADLEKHLEQKYGEKPWIGGVTDNDALLVIYTNEDHTSWTAAIAFPIGISCMAATGKNIELLDIKEKPQPTY